MGRAMTILDVIAEKARERTAEAKRLCPDPLRAAADRPVLRRRDVPGGVDTREPFSFEKALKKPGLSYICEVKRASPSKGLIAPDFPYETIARDYDNAGADCISCLTEPQWFLGKNEYLSAIRRVTDIPILRKDFTVDEYMIYEAKAIGADAVLLIASILDLPQLRAFRQLADELGLTALVEAHGAEEIEMAVAAGARVIGVNNRNLKDFSVDTANAGRLRDLVPEGTLFVSESGVRDRRDILAAETMRADAVLVGEALMRPQNKGMKLRELKASPPRIKICGLMTPEDVRKVNELRPDYAGFVFADTRHRVSEEQAEKLKRALAPGIAAVGVFVDEAPERVVSLMRRGIIDIAQLHGNETDAEIMWIRRESGGRVVKAVVMGAESGCSSAPGSDYPSADYLLFDAGRGSGRTFNWELLASPPGTPFFLAGGLAEDNVAEAVDKVQPFAVDVSSAVEDADLSKNYEKMRRFIGQVRRSRPVRAEECGNSRKQQVGAKDE